MSAASWIVYDATTGAILRTGTCSIPEDVWLQAGPGEVVDMVSDAYPVSDVFHQVDPVSGLLEPIPDRGPNLEKLKAALDTREAARRRALKKRLRDDPAAIAELLERLVDSGVV